jgi:hypothetical protein
MITLESARQLALAGTVPANVGGWRRVELRGAEAFMGQVGDIRETYLGLAVCVSPGETDTRLAHAVLPNSHPDYIPGRVAVWATIPAE